MSLQDKVAIVTGAGRGLGRSYALKLAALGCNIVVADCNLQSAKDFGEEITADSVEQEIQNMGRQATSITVNVGIESEAKKLIQHCLAKFGRVDILVNNAGGIAGKPDESWASTVSERDLKATVERNLYGTIFCCQQASKIMKEQKYGKILNVASQAGMVAQDGGFYASYGVAKAGIIMYTSYLAQELAPHGINVNCIAPAYIETKRLSVTVYEKFPELKQKRLSEIPVGRFGDVNDCAEVVAFLVDDKASYIVGQCISICGGFVKF